MTERQWQCLSSDRPALTRARHAPTGANWYYGMAIPFQAAPRRAGLMANLRDVGERGTDHVDFEAGNDVLLFDDLDGIDASKAIPVNRNHEVRNPHNNELGIMVKHPVHVAFAPLGSGHPHAGTGFGLSEAVCWPMIGRDRRADGTLRPFGGDQAYEYIEVFQLHYDGRTFHVGEPSRVNPETWLEGFHLGMVGLTPPVPDGDDFLFPMHGRRAGEVRMQLGVARWRRVEAMWRPVAWNIVADPDYVCGEMSMVRDIDGSLLYSVRPNTAETCHNMLIWRSEDNGQTWHEQLKVQWIRSAAPVTINQVADGTPYILANLYHTPLLGTVDRRKTPYTGAGWKVIGGYQRDKLYAWPLTKDRHDLDSPLLVRDCDADFGPPPGGTTWSADHAMGLSVRLRDGHWHNLVTYRALERGENGMGCAPTDHTGCFVACLRDGGEARPMWKFADC